MQLKKPAWLLRSHHLYKLLMHLISLLILLLMSPALASDKCTQIFTPPQPQKIKATSQIMYHLDMMWAKGLLTSDDLKAFYRNLQKQKITSPFQHRHNKLSKLELKHHQTLLQNTETQNFDLKKLRQWTESLLSEFHKTSKRKGIPLSELTQKFKDFHFNSVLKKISLMNKEIFSQGVKYNFEIMSSPVTQFQWFNLTMSNPSHFNEGWDSTTIKIHRKQIRLQPNHPVENATLWSILVFANQLSELHGLKPAYILDHIQFKGRASDGTLTSTEDLSAIKFNSTDGHLKNTEGYRLPTLEEYKIILSQAQNFIEKSEQNTTDLTDFAWLKSHSDSITHPVEELEPIHIYQQNFYDLIGNTWELTLSSDFKVFSVGGHSKSPDTFLASKTFIEAFPNQRHPFTSFRLVRSLKSK